MPFPYLAGCSEAIVVGQGMSGFGDFDLFEKAGMSVFDNDMAAADTVAQDAFDIMSHRSACLSRTDYPDVINTIK
jgi:hypothetical protein